MRSFGHQLAPHSGRVGRPDCCTCCCSRSIACKVRLCCRKPLLARVASTHRTGRECPWQVTLWSDIVVSLCRPVSSAGTRAPGTAASCRRRMPSAERQERKFTRALAMHKEYDLAAVWAGRSRDCQRPGHRCDRGGCLRGRDRCGADDHRHFPLFGGNAWSDSAFGLLRAA